MYIKNPNYTLIDLYLRELEDNLKNGIVFKTDYKSYDKEKDDLIFFTCFDLQTRASFNSIFFKNIKYMGTLDFCYNKRTGDVVILKVPYLLFNNTKIPIFTHDLVNIIKEKLKSFIAINKINISFANSLMILAIDSIVPTIIPSINNTKNFQMLQFILKQIEKEMTYIEKNTKKYQERQNKDDLKKERVLAKRRKICDLDYKDFDSEYSFNYELNEKLRYIWLRTIGNLNRHLSRAQDRYRELIRSGDKNDIECDYRNIYGLFGWIEFDNLTPKQIDDYVEKRLQLDTSCKSDSVLYLAREAHDSYISELKSALRIKDEEYEWYLRNNGFYLFLAEDMQDKHNPVFSCKIVRDKLSYDKKRFKQAYELLLYIGRLEGKIGYYKRLLDNPKGALISFKKYNNGWGSIMSFPYWLRVMQDSFPNSLEKIYLLMINPGVKNVDLDDIRKFNSDIDRKYRYMVEDDYKCTRLIITIPKSLEYEEIKELIDYAYKHAKKVNFICEDIDTSSVTKNFVMRYLLANNQNIRWEEKNAFVNIDPDYYRNFFLDCPDNKTYWHRFDYSSSYMFHRRDILSLDGYMFLAKKALTYFSIDITDDLIVNLVLGSYSSNDDIPEVREYYNMLVEKYENDILDAFERSRLKTSNNLIRKRTNPNIYD